MENETWKGLIYKEYDLSDRFEFNQNGAIRNIKSGKTCKQSGNGVTINYEGVTLLVNIPYLLTGKYGKRKGRGAQKKPKAFKVHTLEEFEAIVRRVSLKTWEQMTGNNSGQKRT